MPAVDSSQVPAEPVMILVLTADGRAYFNDAIIPDTPGLDPRAAVTERASFQAIRLGRPVRATGTDPDGTCWPLIIHPDGTATAAGEPTRPQPAATADPTVRPPAGEAEPNASPAGVDPSQIPAWPTVDIVLTPTGQVLIDGTPLPQQRTGTEAHAAAIEYAASQAVRLGRPVRASATDPDGTCWPLIVHPDGTATAAGEPTMPQPTTTRRHVLGWRRNDTNDAGM